MSRISVRKMIIHYIAYFYIRMLFATYRLEENCEYTFGKPFHHLHGVFYFWHQNIIATLFFFFKKETYSHCIIKEGSMGETLGFVAKKLGFRVIYAPSPKIPLHTTRKALEILDLNKKIIVAGDCYNKPTFKLQRWVIYIAAKTRLPLIFIDCQTNSAIRLKKQYKKVQIPLPFSKIKIKVHNPVIPSVDAYKKR